MTHREVKTMELGRTQKAGDRIQDRTRQKEVRFHCDSFAAARIENKRRKEVRLRPAAMRGIAGEI